MSISVALGLAKFIPDIIGMFDKKRGSKAQKLAGVVSGIAENLTGKTGGDAVEAINSDPELALKFQMAVMADAHVEEEIKLRDLESARDAYKVNPDQANKTASHIMRYNLVIVFLLVIINCLAVYSLRGEAAMLAIVSNFIGIVMNSLLSERSAVVGFFFGSSLGSKMKGDK